MLTPNLKYIDKGFHLAASPSAVRSIVTLLFHQLVRLQIISHLRSNYSHIIRYTSPTPEVPVSIPIQL